MKKFCLELVKADTEEQIDQILIEYEIDDSPHFWKDYGGTDANFSVVGAQQETSTRALVEKITNSIDALLVRRCLEEKINPESSNAPKNMLDAVEQFFNVKDGNFAALRKSELREIAEMIQLVATGSKQKPSLAIIDEGEGQTPNRFSDTFLSLLAKNKASIQFVQGVYNMGSTGTFKFCGKKNFQLILSKRCPAIAEISDSSSQQWGFTLVKIFIEEFPVRRPVYRYLVFPKISDVPRFESGPLKIRPEHGGLGVYHSELPFGSFVKMYEFDLPASVRANVYTDLTYRLDSLSPAPALPARVYERRVQAYKGDELAYPGTLQGIKYKMETDGGSVLEQGFPSSNLLSFRRVPIEYTVYAFKNKVMKKRYSPDAIIFSLNGQSHGSTSPSFLTRGNVRLSHIKDEVIVLLDCTKIPNTIQSDLFMTSRDRLRKGETKLELEKQIEEILRNHQGLKELNQRKKDEKSNRGSSNQEFLSLVLQDIITEPIIAQLLKHGKVVHNPVRTARHSRPDTFEPQFPPTFFRMKKDYPIEDPKIAHVGSKIHIDFETDSPNDYFTRSEYPGRLEVRWDDYLLNAGQEYTWNLWNGNFKLIFPADDYIDIDTVVKIRIQVTNSLHETWVHVFYIKFTHPLGPQNPSPKPKKKTPPARKPGNEEGDQWLNNPNRVIVTEKEWVKHEIGDRKMNRHDAGYAIVEPGEFTIYLNIDCLYVRSRLFKMVEQEAKMYTMFYETAMTLLTMTYVTKLIQEQQENLEEEWDFKDSTQKFMDGISVALIPILQKIVKMRDEMLEEDGIN